MALTLNADKNLLLQSKSVKYELYISLYFVKYSQYRNMFTKEMFQILIASVIYAILNIYVL
jgi:hypothetical protein